ncbi:MAG: zinc ABC transporter substrate-binding protein [Caldilineaceae bacterium]|nr:zinc ABC transporter substrate-binding protein [Caldilineaceae bacterium]
MSFSMFRLLITLLVTSLLLAACAIPTTRPPSTAQDAGHDHDQTATESPAAAPVALAEGQKLHVVATSNIVADVVAQIGGDHIDLYAMLPVGADPHSYQATPQDLRMLTDADIVFINGLGLEEAMALTLEEFAAKTVVVNTGVDTTEFGDEHDHAHGEDAHHHEGDDPHTWFSIHAVEMWTHNIAYALSDLDPANAAAYEVAAAAYVEELEALHDELEALVAQIPVEQRRLVTDHDALGYLAAEYGFEIVGSIIPSFSTLAEPSAQQLAALQEQIRAEGVRAIFVSTTVSARMETQLAQDLGIQVVRIYTGSLSEADGPAGNYLDFMRYNVTSIVDTLK